MRACGAPLQFPANISGEARDLLTRVLVVDPAERATMADVRQHAWMLHDYKPIEPLGMDHHALQVLFKPSHAPHLLTANYTLLRMPLRSKCCRNANSLVHVFVHVVFW